MLQEVSRKEAARLRQTLTVDLDAITQRCATATNYLIMPGDRVYFKVPATKGAEELEAIAKAHREIQSPADYRCSVERLDAVTKKLREGLK